LIEPFDWAFCFFRVGIEILSSVLVGSITNNDIVWESTMALPELFVEIIIS